MKNVSGDLNALLKLLKTSCGGGGVVNHEAGEVEVQVTAHQNHRVGER